MLKTDKLYKLHFIYRSKITINKSKIIFFIFNFLLFFLLFFLSVKIIYSHSLEGMGKNLFSKNQPFLELAFKPEDPDFYFTGKSFFNNEIHKNTKIKVRSIENNCFLIYDPFKFILINFIDPNVLIRSLKVENHCTLKKTIPQKAFIKGKIIQFQDDHHIEKEHDNFIFFHNKNICLVSKKDINTKSNLLFPAIKSKKWACSEKDSKLILQSRIIFSQEIPQKGTRFLLALNDGPVNNSKNKKSDKIHSTKITIYELDLFNTPCSKQTQITEEKVNSNIRPAFLKTKFRNLDLYYINNKYEIRVKNRDIVASDFKKGSLFSRLIPEYNDLKLINYDHNSRGQKDNLFLFKKSASRHTEKNDILIFKSNVINFLQNRPHNFELQGIISQAAAFKIFSTKGFLLFFRGKNELLNNRFTLFDTDSNKKYEIDLPEETSLHTFWKDKNRLFINFSEQNLFYICSFNPAVTSEKYKGLNNQCFETLLIREKKDSHIICANRIYSKISKKYYPLIFHIGDCKIIVSVITI
jgi:hypothetical protein